MIRETLKKILEEQFPQEEIVVDYVPKNKQGDYYTNLAFRIASREGKKPLEVAKKIASQIKNPIIKEVTVQKPAFVNFTLSDNYLFDELSRELRIDIGKGKSILIEYVSANPTGPINVVSARAAAIGDSLVRLLKRVGFRSYAEYYINDAGRQIDLLAESVQQRIAEIRGGNARIPDEGYHGDYIKDVAKDAMDRGLTDYEEIKRFAVDYFIDNHRQVMNGFGVHFDVWTRESEIYEKNYVKKVLGILESKNLTYVENGALHFKSSDFGDDKNRVIVTSDDRHTYLLPDIAYHLEKIDRKYDQLVDIWGPDHHGRIKGILGGIQALGYPADILRILIVQEVKLKKGGSLISMSKRAGTFTTLNDMLDKIPRDVVRFFFLMRSASQHLDFDLDLALKQSEENPVYYVQYAHARIKSIIKYASECGISLSDSVDLSLIKEQEEFDLIKDILRLPEILEDAVRNFEPYTIAYYMIDIARDFHSFYQKHRVVGDNKKLTQARLYLISKAANTIKNGLELLGVSCPEKM